MPRARIKSKLPIEIVAQERTSSHVCTQPGPTLVGRARYRHQCRRRAVAVIRPAPIIILFPRSFPSCLPQASCTLVGSGLAHRRRYGDRVLLSLSSAGITPTRLATAWSSRPSLALGVPPRAANPPVFLRKSLIMFRVSRTRRRASASPSKKLVLTKLLTKTRKPASRGLVND